jgi:DNA polymerase-4
VTAPLLDRGSATAIAEEIRAAIRAETGLTASAGVSYNKFLAKLASDHRKPDGLFVITPRMGPRFVEDVPVGRFHGIGPVTAAKMNALGIHTGLDLRQQPRALLIERFGKAGAYYYGLARGIDDRPVSPDRQRKSIGAETTFARDLVQWEEAVPALRPVLAKLWDAYHRAGRPARSVTVKLKYADFRQITRSRTCTLPVDSAEMLEQVSFDLLRPHFPAARGVRLLGVTLSGLESGPDAAPNAGAMSGQLVLSLG